MAVTDGKGGLRMDAYYYAFDKTGYLPVDRVLSAVACAGKAYHCTSDWNDEAYDSWGFGGDAPVDWIQNAANDAAGIMRELVEALEAAQKYVGLVRSSDIEGDDPIFSVMDRIDAVLRKVRGGAS